MQKELSDNWKGAYEEVSEKDVLKSVNVISSLIVFKVKVEEKGKKRLTTRLFPHRNRDQRKGEIRKDSSTAQFGIIRLLLSLCVALHFRLGCIDVQGAYLHSGPIRRQINVRPPTKWVGKRGILWELTKLPYGICEAGRQWAKAILSWMLKDVGLERVFGVSQLFVRRRPDGSIQLILAKVTDDVLVAGKPDDIRWFIDQMKSRFKISKAIVDEEIEFNGCRISRMIDGDVQLSMEAYSSQIKPVSIREARRK